MKPKNKILLAGIDLSLIHIFYRSEINLLELIGSCPESNVSKLSEKSSVTKSAVTQISMKPVSYTHLDVYKRKGEMRILMCFSAPSRTAAVLLSQQVLRR